MKLDGKKIGNDFDILLLDLKTKEEILIPVDGPFYKEWQKLAKLGVCTIEESDYRSPDKMWSSFRFVRVLATNKDRITY